MFLSYVLIEAAILPTKYYYISLSTFEDETSISNQEMFKYIIIIRDLDGYGR